MNQSVNGIIPISKLKTIRAFTKLDNYLRRMSLDELPHLVNVLLEDIIVGPHPIIPEELSDYGS